MNQDKTTLYLVDGSSYLFRAFHGLPPLSTSSGMPVNALLGVANMLKRLLDEYRPAHVAVVFDAKGKTFRHEQYPEYKANRPPMPDDLRVQVEPLHELVKALGFPLLMEPGVEADDVIGTLARQAKEQGMKVVVSTGDKDLAQLVNEDVSLVNTMTNTAMDEQGVVAKFGVKPEQMIDYLTLVGDSSDNIPGVPKVGPKTAARWLNEYGSLENLLAHADEIKGKVGEYLRNSIEQIPISHDLVTIRADLELPEKVADLQYLGADKEKLLPLLEKYEFKSWLSSMHPAGDVPAASASKKGEYECLLTQDDFEQWLDRLKQAGLIAFDLETTSLNYMQADIVGVSFAVEPGKAAYLPVAHRYPGCPEQLHREQVLQALKPLLEDPKVAKLGQHFKYDMNVLARYGIDVQGLSDDTMLASYVLDASGSRHDMDSLADKYLGIQTVHYEDIAGKGKSQIGFDEVDLETATGYAAEDADVTLRLHEHFMPLLEQEEAMFKVYRDIEMPLVPVLAKMEQTGVLIDPDELKRQSHELGKRMIDLEKQCHELAGQPFNLGSPKQLQSILYEQMGLKPIRKTPKGQPSTAEDVLQEYAAMGEQLPATILEYRGLAKLKSTYTDKLVVLIDESTGRVHTSYHQAVAATGRLSSSDPNLQNIPIRTKEGRRVRKAFIAPEGWSLLAADYSQIELRIMAHLSGDEGLLNAFREGKDIHAATAAEVFGAENGEVSSESRRSAKAINFGLIYGMSAFGLARQLNIGRQEAAEYINLYFDRYPGVKTYMEETRKMAHEKGYVETLFGRRLYLPNIKSRNGALRQGAERAAINAPMQGTAADIIKMAMLRVYDYLADRQDQARLLMQVHDELVLEVNNEHLDEIRQNITGLMENAAELAVPLIVDSGVGKNWDEAH